MLTHYRQIILYQLKVINVLNYIMKKALSEILRVASNDGKAINISIVQKQSDLGLVFNRRLFILVENQFLGYISQFKESDDPHKIDTFKCKTTIPIKNIIGEQLELNGELLGINFIMIQNGKKVAKKWVIKMTTKELTAQWFKLISNEISKHTSRKSQSKSKRKADYSPKRSEVGTESHFVLQENKNAVPLAQIKNEPRNDDNIKVKDSLKKDFAIVKKQTNQKQSKQYVNLMYETQRQNSPGAEGQFILNQIDEERNVKVSKKLNFGSPQDVREKQRAKAEYERILRDKELVEKKQRDLQQKQRRIQQEQFRLEQERKIIKRQQQTKNMNLPKSESFGNNTLAQPQGQKYFPRNPRQAHDNSKPNYDRLISKVINSESEIESLKSSKLSQMKQSQKFKELEQVHDYLFELEKLKMSNIAIQEQTSKNVSRSAEDSGLPQSWAFKYLFKLAEGNQSQVVNSFVEYCSNLLKEVALEFHLPQKKRKYLPKYKSREYLVFAKDDITFKMAVIDLKEVFNKNQQSARDKICDQSSVKKLTQQFKNYSTLYSALRQCNSRIVKAPLCCLCQYSGLVALFKANSQFDRSPSVMSDKKVLNDIDLVSENLRVSETCFKNRQNCVLLRVDSEYYRSVAAQIGAIYTKFDYCLVEEIKQLMPIDTVLGRAEQNRDSGLCLRKQFLSQFKDYKEPMSEQILSILKKSSSFKNSRVSAFTKQNQKYQKLTENLLIPISSLIKQLDSLDFYFIHPSQLEQKMHQMGINMRYLGLVHENLTLNFSRTYIMSQIAARTCKTLFRKTLHDVLLQQSDLHKNAYAADIRSKTIDYFNCILGTSVETKTIWRVLAAHSLNAYNVEVDMEEINRGYFVNALIYHCGIEADVDKIQIATAFEADQFFNQQNFKGLKVRVKNYEENLTEKQQEIIDMVERQDPKIVQKLEQNFSIETKPLPSSLLQSKKFDKIRAHAANFISPDLSLSGGYSSLNLYNDSKIVSKTQFSLKLVELKWHLNRQKKTKYIALFTSINQEIIANCGDFHPLLSELYDTMSEYHRESGNYEDALTFAKSSIINLLRICGATHPRVAACYYGMGVCCIKAGKKDQAAGNLQKAKNILDANQLHGSILYAHVCFKLGLLLLSEGKVKQAENIVGFALSAFNTHANEGGNLGAWAYEDERVECYEMLARCYELEDSKDRHNRLAFECQKEMKYIKVPANLEKILKIVFYRILSGLSTSSAEIYLDILAKIPAEFNVHTYLKGHERIKERVDEGTLIENTKSYFENIEAIERFLKENRNLDGWQGFQQTHERQTVNDFISLSQQLLCFLGEGFVTGSVRDNL